MSCTFLEIRGEGFHGGDHCFVGGDKLTALFASAR